MEEDPDLVYAPSQVYSLIRGAQPARSKPTRAAPGELLNESDFQIPTRGASEGDGSGMTTTAEVVKSTPFHVLDKTSTSHFRNSKHYVQWGQMKEHDRKVMDNRSKPSRRNRSRNSPLPFRAEEIRDWEENEDDDGVVDAFSQPHVASPHIHHAGTGSNFNLSKKIRPRVFYRRRHKAGRIFSGDEEPETVVKTKTQPPKQQNCSRCECRPCMCCERCLNCPCQCRICVGCGKYEQECQCCQKCSQWPCICRCEGCNSLQAKCQCCDKCEQVNHGLNSN